MRLMTLYVFLTDVLCSTEHSASSWGQTHPTTATKLSWQKRKGRHKGQACWFLSIYYKRKAKQNIPGVSQIHVVRIDPLHIPNYIWTICFDWMTKCYVPAKIGNRGERARWWWLVVMSMHGFGKLRTASEQNPWKVCRRSERMPLWSNCRWRPPCQTRRLLKQGSQWALSCLIVFTV